MIKSLIVASLIGLASVPLAAQAQQAGNQQPALPPALQAAIASGNPAAIQQAINTLSGGNASRAGALAVQVMAAAERLIASNPAGAAAAANAAVNVIKSNPTASMQQTSAVLSAANRIMINPAVIRAAPAVVAQIASNAVSIASNPTVLAALPTLAAAVATAADTVASNPAVIAAAPAAATLLSQSVDTLTTAVDSQTGSTLSTTTTTTTQTTSLTASPS